MASASTPVMTSSQGHAASHIADNNTTVTPSPTIVPILVPIPVQPIHGGHPGHGHPGHPHHGSDI